jgi:thiamine kinase-like enzyme
LVTIDTFDQSIPSIKTALMIPENKRPAVTKALQKAFHVDEPEEIVQLTKGLSGALVFKITVHEIPHLLRIITRTETRDKPEYYFECLQTAANAGLAPRIHYLNIEDKISITDFIDDQDFPIKEARIMMADTLRDLHELPKFPYQLNYMDSSDIFLKKFLEADIVPDNAIKDLLDLYARIANVYPRHDAENLVSCHNDVKRDNIIYDGVRPWLVDWEAARLNDRYVDLAAIANFVVKNDDDETEFLKRYFGETFDGYKQGRFFLMRQVVHMFCFTLCSLFASGSKPININMSTLPFHEFHERLWNGQINLDSSEEKLHYALVHLKELEHRMQTKRLDESLKIVADRHKFQ